MTLTKRQWPTCGMDQFCSIKYAGAGVLVKFPMTIGQAGLAFLSIVEWVFFLIFWT